MKFIDTHLKGLIVIEPDVYEDSRGYFYESFNKKNLAPALQENTNFYQDNQSLSNKGVLRGLHLQNPPFDQAKLVRVIKGAVLDVAVDIRKNSPTYGKHFSIELNEQNKKMLFIPSGFAHGFLTLEDNTIFFYKCTNYYNKSSEVTIKWDDKDLNIKWGNLLESELIISDKDKSGIPFSTFNSLF